MGWFVGSMLHLPGCIVLTVYSGKGHYSTMYFELTNPGGTYFYSLGLPGSLGKTPLIYHKLFSIGSSTHDISQDNPLDVEEFNAEASNIHDPFLLAFGLYLIFFDMYVYAK